MVFELLRLGADINIRLNDGKTALDRGLYHGFITRDMFYYFVNNCGANITAITLISAIYGKNNDTNDIIDLILKVISWEDCSLERKLKLYCFAAVKNISQVTNYFCNDQVTNCYLLTNKEKIFAITMDYASKIQSL